MMLSPHSENGTIVLAHAEAPTAPFGGGRAAAVFQAGLCQSHPGCKSVLKMIEEAQIRGNVQRTTYSRGQIWGLHDGPLQATINPATSHNPYVVPKIPAFCLRRPCK